jgi:hypothetical protein
MDDQTEDFSWVLKALLDRPLEEPVLPALPLRHKCPDLWEEVLALRFENAVLRDEVERLEAEKVTQQDPKGIW